MADKFVNETGLAIIRDWVNSKISQVSGAIAKVKRNGTELPIDPSDKSVNIVVPDTAATQSADGLMSSTDKTKLDGIESGAQANVQAPDSAGAYTIQE